MKFSKIQKMFESNNFERFEVEENHIGCTGLKKREEKKIQQLQNLST